MHVTFDLLWDHQICIEDLDSNNSIMKVIFGIVFLCLLSYGCIDNQDSKYVACVADDTKTNMSNGFRNVLDSLIRKEIATDALIASKQNYTPYPVYNLIIVDDSVNNV